MVWPANRLFWFLIVACLAMRLAVLLTGSGALIFDFFDEGHRGTIANGLIEGWPFALWEYQWNPYDGGALVIGLLAVPLFWLLGPTLFALKLVPLGFSLATLALSLRLFRQYFGDRVALLVGVLFMVPPPVFTELTLSATESHAESLVFTILLFWWLYRFLEQGRRRDLFLVGLTAGFGFWFTPIILSTFLTCLASWAMLDRRTFVSRRLWVVAAAFAMGMLPWFAYNATHGWPAVGFLIGVSPLGTGVWWAEPARIGARLIELLTMLPQIFRFRRVLGIPGELLTWAYGIGAILLIGGFLITHRRRLTERRLLPLLLFPLIHLLCYAASRFPIRPVESPPIFDEFRYFAPLYFATFCWMAVALDALRRSGPWLAFFLALGFLGFGPLLFNEPFGRTFRYPGYSYAVLGELGARTGRLAEVAGRVEPVHRHALYYGWSRLWQERPPRDAGERQRRLARLETEVPPRYRRFFRDGPDPLFLKGSSVPRDEAVRMLEGLAGLDRVWFGRGLGREQLAAWISIDPPRGWMLIGSRLLPDDQPAFAWGIGWGIRFERMEDRRWARDLLEQLPAAIRPWAEEGFRACEVWYGMPSDQ